MLQLHLSDRQIYCPLRCDLYQRLDGNRDHRFFQNLCVSPIKIIKSLLVPDPSWVPEHLREQPEEMKSLDTNKSLDMNGDIVLPPNKEKLLDADGFIKVDVATNV